MKIVWIILSVLMLFCCCSNNSDDMKLGNWKSCKVSAEDIAISEKDGDYHIYVPASGAVFSVMIDNYPGWYIGSISTQTTDKNDFRLIYYSGQNKETKDKDWYEFAVNEKKMRCSVFSNQLSIERTIKLVMSVGNAACYIYIHQAAK